MNLLEAAMDEQFQREMAGGLTDVANRGIVAGALGAPIDLISMALRPLGYKNPEPVMGSEWIGRKMENLGLVSSERRPAAEAMSSLLTPAAASKLPLLAGMAMSPAGKARLLADLQAGRGSGTYRLGDVTEGQGKGLDALFNRPTPSRDVMMTDRALEHILDRRLNKDGFAPDQIADIAERAMARRSASWADPSLSHQQPSLVNRGQFDQATGRRYDAQMPMRQGEEGYEAVSVVPRGLPAPTKNKAPKR